MQDMHSGQVYTMKACTRRTKLESIQTRKEPYTFYTTLYIQIPTLLDIPWTCLLIETYITVYASLCFVDLNLEYM